MSEDNADIPPALPKPRVTAIPLSKPEEIPPANTPRPDETAGQKLSKSEEIPKPSIRLEEDKRHPVLIFGSSLAGKSTLIMSMINALEKSGADGSIGVSPKFGYSFYSRRDPRVELQMRHAKDFYEIAAHRWISTHASLDSTQVDLPYFIPIDMTIRGKESDVVKIAILDGRGEWYHPMNNPGSSMHQDLHEDIVDILKNYSYGISIICVAPYSLSPDNLRDTTNSDAGLLAALIKYEESRDAANRHNDDILFILSKWDQVANPQHDQRFSRIAGCDVVAEIEERYRRSWDRFRNMPIGPSDWVRRCFMQYSSCSFVDGKPRIQPHLIDNYLRYPRTLLNWIFGNARRFEVRQAGVVDTGSLVLFPDVIPPEMPTVPISERFLQLITR